MADDALAPQAGSTADDGRAPLMPAAVAAALARAAAAFDAAEAPDKTHDETVAELERERWSAAERKGLGRSTFLSAAYHLPKYIFVELAYDGWVGLDAVALEAKGFPFKRAMLDEAKRLVVGNGDLSCTGQVFEKRRWCAVLGSLAHDRMMEDVVNLTCVTSGLAVMSFVNATCARSGAFAKGRFDRRRSKHAMPSADEKVPG